MKKLLAGCVVAGGLLAAQGASGADLSLAPLYKAPPAEVTQAYNWAGLYFGGTAGYNWQVGKAVFGIEGDLNWSGLQGANTSTPCPLGCTTSDTWLSTVRGRVGYAFDRFMPYITGGLAVGDIRAATPGFTGGTSTNAGWTVGAGLEVALPGNWSAKAEYLRVDLGGFNCGSGCGLSPADNVSLHENVFRAGVDYHFGWGK